MEEVGLLIDNKILEFPLKTKNKNETFDKLDVAYKMLELMNDNGIDFHIVISSEDAENIFDLSNKVGENVILTSNLEKSKALNIENSLYFPIKGDEF